MKWFVSFVLVAGLLAGCGDDSDDSEYSERVKPTEQSQTPGTYMYGVMKGIFEGYTERAEKGSGNAQLNLVWHYENGEGVPRDYVAAYAWQIIAQANEGSNLAKKMTPDEIAKAQKLSKALLKKIEANKKEKADKKADKNSSIPLTTP